MAIPSYGKIWNLGHRQTLELFDGPVTVQEKIDGSYFAFGILDGRLQCRSKSALIDMDAPDKMFSRAVEIVKSLEDKLTPNYVYCCEYLQKPKHNTLAYDRIPQNHLVLFDVEIEPRSERFLDQDQVREIAEHLWLEPCPEFWASNGWDKTVMPGLLDYPSVLGGQKIEGVVIKNYNKFGIDGKILRGKFVSPSFKEVHTGDWKERHPGKVDILQQLAHEYRTPARWHKAVQHLRDAGQLTGEPKDIGPLLKEVNKDVLEECADEIKEKLLQWAWKSLSRELTKGFPEWYRGQLGAADD